MRQPHIPKAASMPEPVSTPQPTLQQAPVSRGRTPELEAAIGARIRAARVADRMSQGALGEAIGVSFQQVQKYELGKDRVAASTLQRIASVLGVHPGSFFDDDVPVSTGPIPDVKAMFKSANVLGQIRNPRVLKQLLALATVLVEVDRKRTGALDSDEDEEG